MPVLEATGLGYRIGESSLVEDVNLELEAGELLAVVGPNGAGKSTLLRLLAGDLSPDEGEVRLFDRPIGSYSSAERALRRSVLSQQTLLQFGFTGRQVVEMGRSPHRRRFGRPNGDDRAAVDSALHAADASELGERLYPTLSGGEQARVSLARVLAQETPVLLLDEPTASLDIAHQERAMAVARKLADEGGAIVVVIHDLNLAAAHADRIAVLDQGRLAVCARPWQALTPELLETVFRHGLLVCRHPTRSCPLVVSASP